MKAKPPPGVRLQVAALPIRIGEDGAAHVLLLTSRETRRWVIPKGWPMKGLKPWEAAATEALEEAGVVGRPLKRSLGRYTYFKRQATHFDVCDVDVYPLLFSEQLEGWREKGQREADWVTFAEAAERVEEPGLVGLLLRLDKEGVGEIQALAARPAKPTARKRRRKSPPKPAG